MAMLPMFLALGMVFGALGAAGAYVISYADTGVVG